MKSVMPEILSSLIGLKCNEVKIDDEGDLMLEFEEKAHDCEASFNHWKFQTGSCSWRIVENEKILCGLNDGKTYSSVFNNLKEQKLISIERISYNDISFIFKGGLEIQLLSQSRDKECFSIIAPSKECVSFSSAGGWFE